MVKYLVIPKKSKLEILHRNFCLSKRRFSGVCLSKRLAGRFLAKSLLPGHDLAIVVILSEQWPDCCMLLLLQAHDRLEDSHLEPVSADNIELVKEV